MKTIYKILFSMCGTLVCAIYSVRSFAAKCSFLTDSSVCDGITVYRGNVGEGCVGNTTVVSYVKMDTGHCLHLEVCTQGCWDRYYYGTETDTLAGADNCSFTYVKCTKCPAYGGVDGSGAGNMKGSAACFIPANQIVELDGEHGKFRFTERCFYSLS